MSMESSPSRCAELQCPAKGWALPEHMRNELSTGFGELVKLEDLKIQLEGCVKLLSVGDFVSYTLLDNGFKPDLIIYDLKTERRPFSPLSSKLSLLCGEEVVVKNPAGYITPELVTEISSALGRDAPTKIRVDGEEDLAALVCAAAAPTGSCLMYGVPGVGMALLKVDAASSDRAKSLLYSMEELN
ncbi:GTP-dependent dephospho-CoA kinase family protein [Candidatus Methanomassiliicoccus intestinalis]|uniref:GTP-dependent dephospho-CoA kinase family protein n=2 Tax=Candidatus Methanomassiliicoccus intestinalis TaxID=1406512 RepID=UPI0037DC305C